MVASTQISENCEDRSGQFHLGTTSHDVKVRLSGCAARNGGENSHKDGENLVGSLSLGTSLV